MPYKYECDICNAELMGTSRGAVAKSIEKHSELTHDQKLSALELQKQKERIIPA
ncbi:MAG: hypothetical protein GF309_11235 [Candidatus Lokiarchaeota archaeon]|nr:hypothetical protein [Candidatus Lokiarchaeota archaeon]